MRKKAVIDAGCLMDVGAYGCDKNEYIRQEVYLIGWTFVESS